eukprot:TRINITY_DN193_c2_g2_i1.p1 TRINITY_DN193_c2_g2~~TRINITY_DN193_c2_g2_i1.p1  ORF type:complete len:528 (-),score=143.00 TRINITY_DN193_c2_g2_i1:149-1732(-)
MSALWGWIKEHPYISTVSALVVVGGVYRYRENSRIARLKQEQIRKNIEETRKRDAEIRKRKQEEQQKKAQETASQQPAVSTTTTTTTTTSTTTTTASVQTPKLYPNLNETSSSIKACIEGTAVPFSKDSFKGRSYLLLFFYAGNWQNATELHEFQDFTEHLYKKYNVAIAGCTSDSIFSHQSWYELEVSSNGGGGRVKYPLVSDNLRELATHFNVPLDGSKFKPSFYLISPVDGAVVLSSSDDKLVPKDIVSKIADYFKKDINTVIANIKKDVELLVKAKNCGPILVRLAWHDAGTYDMETKTGGAHATMQFKTVGSHGANAGLQIARDLLEPIRAAYPQVSLADFWQLAAVAAISAMGGPQIPFRYGRTDHSEPQSTPDGRLPDASKGADHLRELFAKRMGFSDQEIVALSGAHTLGRCHKDRSGYEGAWTAQPLVFDNQYFVDLVNKKWELSEKDGKKVYVDGQTDLIMLPSDMVLVTDGSFAEYTKAFAQNSEEFFVQFTKAFQKLQELGYEEGSLKSLSTPSS